MPILIWLLVSLALSLVYIFFWTAVIYWIFYIIWFNVWIIQIAIIIAIPHLYKELFNSKKEREDFLKKNNYN